MGREYRGCLETLTALTERLLEARPDPLSSLLLNSLRDMGLMNGRGDNCFEPKGTATRAEICAVVYRLMEMSGIAG